jgi:hypothetical protein
MATDWCAIGYWSFAEVAEDLRPPWPEHRHHKRAGGLGRWRPYE